MWPCQLLKVNHHPPKFGAQRLSGGGDIMVLVVIDIGVIRDMFLVDEEQDSTYSCWNMPLLFISKKTWLETIGMSY